MLKSLFFPIDIDNDTDVEMDMDMAKKSSVSSRGKPMKGSKLSA